MTDEKRIKLTHCAMRYTFASSMKILKILCSLILTLGVVNLSTAAGEKKPVRSQKAKGEALSDPTVAEQAKPLYDLLLKKRAFRNQSSVPAIQKAALSLLRGLTLSGDPQSFEEDLFAEAKRVGLHIGPNTLVKLAAGKNFEAEYFFNANGESSEQPLPRISFASFVEFEKTKRTYDVGSAKRSYEATLEIAQRQGRAAADSLADYMESIPRDNPDLEYIAASAIQICSLRVEAESLSCANEIRDANRNISDFRLKKTFKHRLILGLILSVLYVGGKNLFDSSFYLNVDYYKFVKNVIWQVPSLIFYEWMLSVIRGHSIFTLIPVTTAQALRDWRHQNAYMNSFKERLAERGQSQLLEQLDVAKSGRVPSLPALGEARETLPPAERDSPPVSLLPPVNEDFVFGNSRLSGNKLKASEQLSRELFQLTSDRHHNGALFETGILLSDEEKISFVATADADDLGKVTAYKFSLIYPARFKRPPLTFAVDLPDGIESLKDLKAKPQAWAQEFQGIATTAVSSKNTCRTPLEGPPEQPERGEQSRQGSAEN